MFVGKTSTECTSPLPAEKMPSCWNQEDRMNALFSPLRSRSANPQDWLSKYKFWKDLIYEWLAFRMCCSFSISDLNEAFRRRGCRPLCLTTIVEELHRNNEIMLETDFLQEPCKSWTSWSIDIFVKKPLVWSFSKIKNYVVNSEVNVETKYVHLQILKELGNIVLSVLDDKKHSVLVSLSELVESCQNKTNKTISDYTIMLAVIWLKRMKKIAFKYGQNGQEVLIKAITHSMDEITEVEEGLYELQKQENKLMKEIHILEQGKINIINETKSYLAKGLRQVAKTHLRKKMDIEKTIEKQSQILENLRSLISSIQETHSNTAVLSAYKTGTDVLKRLTQNGLSESNVRDIMDELSETMEEHKEIGTLLSDTLQSNESDTDLEQELEELLKSDAKVSPRASEKELNASIDEIEQSLRNLSVEDSPVPDKVVTKSMEKRTQEKKPLTGPQCA